MFKSKPLLRAAEDDSNENDLEPNFGNLTLRHPSRSCPHCSDRINKPAKQTEAKALQLLSAACSTKTAEEVSKWLYQTKIVTPQDKEYPILLDYVNNGQEHTFGIKISSIVRIIRNNEKEFQHDRKTSRRFRMLLWHGTKQKYVAPILENGFVRPLTTNQMFGNGTYFADRISKSGQYCDGTNSGATGYIFLCDVLLGKMYTAKNAKNDYSDVPKGFDSIRCAGSKIPVRKDQKSISGSIVPSGVTVPCNRFPQHSVNFNEFVVYDPNQIRIKYLLTVQFTSQKYVNK